MNLGVYVRFPTVSRYPIRYQDLSRAVTRAPGTERDR